MTLTPYPLPSFGTDEPFMADNALSCRQVQQAAARRELFDDWSRVFLTELAETSNVSASARKAGILPARAYEERRTNIEFNRMWQVALCEGYEHLEMELLRRLRGGEIKPASGAKRGVRAFDNATALRLLNAHRESAARMRAIRDNEDAEAILASINTKLDKMRERMLIASASGGGDGLDDGDEAPAAHVG